MRDRNTGAGRMFGLFLQMARFRELNRNYEFDAMYVSCRYITLPCIILSLVFMICGCGQARYPGSVGENPVQYRYDEKLILRLEEIIPDQLDTERLQNPVSVETTIDGGLIILEQDPPRIITLDSNRHVIRKTGGAGFGAARLERPRFVRSGFGLTVNVADEGGRLLVYDSQLRFLNSLEPAYEATGYPAGSPSGIAVTEFGDTYLADRDNDIIYHFDPTGKFFGSLGGADAGVGRLARPEGLTVTRDGTLIVGDTDARRVVVFDQDGGFLSSIGDGELVAPVAVALTPDERAVFIADREKSRLDLYSLSGKWLVSWEGTDLSAGGVGRITDVLVRDMFLYVVDQGNRQILKLRLVPPGYREQ